MGLASITRGPLTSARCGTSFALEFRLNYNRGSLASGLKSSTISLNYTNHFPTSGYISSVQIEFYKVPSVFMNMNVSLQKLKMKDKTWVRRADDELEINFVGWNCETSQLN